MKIIPVALLMFFAAGPIVEARAATAAATFDWPVPSGWKTETIPFPLDFAPDLKHDGVEELRFAPNFFKPEAPGYWSYAFVWWLKDRNHLDAQALSDELGRYFKGLSMAVGAKKFKFDPERFKAEIGETAKGTFQGKAELYDAFTTGKPLTLTVEGRSIACPAQEREAVLFLLSPKQAGDSIWKELHARADSFRCAKD